jgi:hypothetical protein
LASWVPPADPSRSMLKVVWSVPGQVVRPKATGPRPPVIAASSASTGFAVLDPNKSNLGACWQAWLKSPLNAGGAWTYHLAPWRHRRQRCIPRGFRPVAKSTAFLVALPRVGEPRPLTRFEVAAGSNTRPAGLRARRGAAPAVRRCRSITQWAGRAQMVTGSWTPPAWARSAQTIVA